MGLIGIPDVGHRVLMAPLGGLALVAREDFEVLEALEVLEVLEALEVLEVLEPLGLLEVSGVLAQPQSIRPSKQGDIRLRLRLSNIFQRPTRVGRNFVRLPSNLGARNPSHGSNCQSPRIQRCCRLV